ncbi:hypothetical protein C8R43DRAFT_1114680 [Mycena crocata]|nr:hypothetical protein C8R43DRAFT_1114680 [Mycena crocata]
MTGGQWQSSLFNSVGLAASLTPFSSIFHVLPSLAASPKTLVRTFASPAASIVLAARDGSEASTLHSSILGVTREVAAGAPTYLIIIHTQGIQWLLSRHFRAQTQRDAWFYEVLVENSVRWAEQGFGGYLEPFQALYVTPNLNSTEAAATMQPLFDYVKSLAPNDTGVQILSLEMPSYGAFYQAFLAGSGAVCLCISFLLVADHAGSPLVRTPMAQVDTPSDLVSQCAGCRRAALVDALMQTLAHVTFDLSLIATTPYNVPDDGSTSVTEAWRTAVWHAVAEGGWDGAAPVDEETAAYTGISAAADFLRAITPDGAYQNEADVHEPNHAVSFWGTHYPRLLQIKKKYDPDNLLTCWHCVGYNPNTPRFSCYV